MKNELGLYIHIPFCEKKCNYCDFYSLGGSDKVEEKYIQSVISEIDKYKPFTCSTVYFGGGTPSLLSPEQVQEILSCLDINEDAEITLEANPESLTQEKLCGYFKYGVNRLSIGVQTARDKNLLSLGRLHNSQKVVQAFDMAKKAGFTNISADLMLGLDGYTYQELDDTIKLIQNCGAVHISAYMLKIEEGTLFYKCTPQNLSTEEELAEFYLYTCRTLEQLGYIQYEISNFAKEGYHSRHNSIYWQLKDYLGIGPSAHSCINGKRFFYPKDIKGFIENPEAVQDGVADVNDYIMLSLRLKEGLSLQTLEKRYNITFTQSQLNKIEQLKKAGYIQAQADRIWLTPQGFLLENSIACEFMV